MSVGLLAVPFEFVQYVGHLSKWFVFVLMFKFWSVSRLFHGRHTINNNYSVSATLHLFRLSPKSCFLMLHTAVLTFQRAIYPAGLPIAKNNLSRCGLPRNCTTSGPITQINCPQNTGTGPRPVGETGLNPKVLEGI